MANHALIPCRLNSWKWLLKPYIHISMKNRHVFKCNGHRSVDLYILVKTHPKRGPISGTILRRKTLLKISMTNWFHLRLEIFSNHSFRYFLQFEPFWKTSCKGFSNMIGPEYTVLPEGLEVIPSLRRLLRYFPHSIHISNSSVNQFKLD